jgi:hypothetical protein
MKGLDIDQQPEDGLELAVFYRSNKDNFPLQAETFEKMVSLSAASGRLDKTELKKVRASEKVVDRMEDLPKQPVGQSPFIYGRRTKSVQKQGERQELGSKGRLFADERLEKIKGGEVLDQIRRLMEHATDANDVWGLRKRARSACIAMIMGGVQSKEGRERIQGDALKKSPVGRQRIYHTQHSCFMSREEHDAVRVSGRSCLREPNSWRICFGLDRLWVALS